jgi:hypothetical protein
MFKQFALVLAIIVPSTTSAEPEKLFCTFGTGSENAPEFAKFLSNHAAFTIDTENGAATAYDSYVHLMHQAPIPARFKKTRDGKYQLRWKVAGVPVEITQFFDDGWPRTYEGKITLRYSFKFDPRTKQGMLSARGGGKTFETPSRMSCKETTQDIVFRILQPT